MSFLSPWMLLGLLGVLIPVVVHLQGRRKAKVVHFAALEFLLKTDKRLAKRLVVRQVLQLIFRILICLVVTLILAKPYASCQSPGPAVRQGAQAAVLILDTSATAGYQRKGRTLLSRQIASALSLVDQLGPEAEIAIFTTTKVGHAELSRDHVNLKETLRNTKLTFQAADSQTAVQRALQVLASSGYERKTLFLLSALTKSTMPEPLLASLASRPEGISLQILNPTEDSTELPNLAITDIQVLADGSIGSRGIVVHAKVANYGSEAVMANLSLRLGKELVAQGELLVPAGQTLVKQFSASLSEEQRTTEISVELGSDALGADNVYFAVADARDQIPVLLIDGDPRTVRHEDELYYLEAALRPGDRAESGTSISTTTPDSLADLELSDFDVIVVANVPVLPTLQVERLADWTFAGGGLLVAMGSKVDADDYNQHMAPLLAQSLRSALDLKHGRSQTAGGTLRLSKLEVNHDIFSVFSKDAPGLYNASFDQIMLLGPTTAVKNRKVLARYDNGAAALVEAHRGSGILLLFSSTLDREWNDLAFHPGYLPFMQQMVRYLASSPVQSQEQQHWVGDLVSLKVAAGDARIEVTGPEGIRMVLEGDKVAGRSTARLDRVDLPGVYQVQSVNAEGQIQSARTEAAFAANLAPSVGNMTPVATDILENSDKSSPNPTSKVHKRRVELWHAVSACLLLLLLLESGLGLYGTRAKKTPPAPEIRLP